MTCAVRLVLTVSLALSLSCLEARNERCGNNTVCQVGYVCHAEGDTCVLPEARNCGDGTVDPGEVCDDGDREDDGACSADCQSDHSCGNGIVDKSVGEVCDCGAEPADVASSEESELCKGRSNSDSGGYCKADCTRHCGDGVKNDDEACDYGHFEPNCVEHGFDIGVPTCSTECVLDLSACGRRGFYQDILDARVRALWGTSEHNVYAVGESGAFFRYRDREWQQISGPNTEAHLEAVSGSAPNNVFAVGTGGTILRYDGTRLTNETVAAIAANQRFIDVWASDAFNALAFTDRGTVMERQLRGSGDEPGDTFTWVHRFSMEKSIVDAWVRTPDDFFVVGTDGAITHFVNKEIEPLGGLIDGHYWSIWGAEDQLIAVGDSGAIRRFHDGRWQEDLRYDPAYDLRSVWGSDLSSFFVAGTGGIILRCDVTECMKLNTVPVDEDFDTFPRQNFDRIWNSGPTDVFALVRNDSVIWRYDGVEWSINDRSIIEAPIRGIWGQSARNIHAIAQNGTYATFDGQTWTSNLPRPAEIPDPWTDGDPGLNSLTGTADGTLHAVGDAGMVFTFDGAWHRDEALQGLLPEPAPRLLAVWASAPLFGGSETGDAGDLIVAGDSGAMWRYRGATQTWAAMTLELRANEEPPTLTALWGRATPAGYEGYATGDNGIIYSFDKTGDRALFSYLNNEADSALFALSGADSSVYAVGQTNAPQPLRATIWHCCDDNGWGSVDSKHLEGIGLRAVWAIADDRVYAAGTDGAILRYDAGQWTPVSPFFEDSTEITTVWGDDELVVFGDVSGKLLGLYLNEE